MRKVLLLLILPAIVSCVSHNAQSDNDLITVSIAPFGFFVETIGGGDFRVNVMVPEGADPHMYEPSPAQISSLRKSVAYISDGYLDFELAWLEKFYSVNNSMKKLKLADSIDLIRYEANEGEHGSSAADPHFWVSPVCAMKIAAAVKSLLCDLKPATCLKYEQNFKSVFDSISKIHQRAQKLFTPFADSPFIVFHHTLDYFARDYNLRQISVEKEGKEPSPGWLKEVIDEAKKNRIRVILVQREFDEKNAKVVASESGAVLKQIKPLSPDWYSSVNEIIDAIYESLTGTGR